MLIVNDEQRLRAGIGVTTFLPRRIPAKRREIRAKGVRQALYEEDRLGSE